MSDTTAPPADASQKPQEGQQADDEAKTFDAEYVDKLRKEAAKYRTEAKANADAAKRLAAIEESQKSDAQKAADRIAALEAEVEATKTAASRYKVAARFDMTDEQAELILTAPDEATQIKQGEAFAGRQDERKKQGNRVPTEGTNPPAGKPDEMREFARGIFDRAKGD